MPAIVAVTFLVNAYCLPTSEAAPPAAATAKKPIPREDDDAALRRDARRAWYGGDASPAYRRFLHAASQAERGRRAARAAALRARIASANTSTSTATASTTAVPPTWMNLGPAFADFEVNGGLIPGLDSGRLSSIVVHPIDRNTIYVATAGGGVWKTSDGGATWAPITDSIGDLYAGALEMDPQDPNALYLGLGDFYDSAGVGIGAVLKSTDAGATWSSTTPLVRAAASPATGTVTATYVKQLLANPSVPGLILAATDVGLFRSTDSGTTWRYVDLGAAGGPTPVIWSIAWTGGNGFALSMVNASGANGGGLVFVSQDAGASWIAAAGPSSSAGVARMTLAAAPSNRSLLYALAANGGTYDFGGIFRSYDGGRTWITLGAASYNLTNRHSGTFSMSDLFQGQGFYDQLVAVSPTNTEVAYFGGALFMAGTTDGGGSFSAGTDWLGAYGLPYVHADFQCGTFDSAGTFYVGTDGGIFKSTDNGLHWSSSLNAGIISHLVYSVGSSLANRSVVIGGLQDDGTRLRSGATATFNQVIGGDGFGSHIHPTNPSLMLGSLYFTQIYRSVDGGNVFTDATNGLGSNSSQFFTKIVPGLGDPSGNTVYTVGDLAPYRSTDYAGTWTPLGNTGLPSYGLRNIAASKSNPQTLGLVTEPSNVYLSADGGASWMPAAALPNSGGALSSIWFDTTNPATIYVTSVARVPTANHLWKSTDGGFSWNAIGTAGSGLPTGIPVNFVQNDPNTPQRLYAGTAFGLYQSEDGGATWSVAGSGLPLVDVADIYVAPDSSMIRVATFGRGFWELTTAAPSQGITITPPTVPAGVVGGVYPTVNFIASGGTGPWSFTVSGGSLPSGLSLTSAGVLGGTPRTSGTFSFRVTATDSTSAALGGPLSGSQGYVITIGAPAVPITFTPAALPGSRIYSVYPATTISASGGTAPYTFSVLSGALPPGLTLSAAGVLSGASIPGAGSYSFVVAADDSTPAALGGPFRGTQFYSVLISLATQTISFPPIADRMLGTPDFPITATATSGGRVYFFSLTPTTCSITYFPPVHLIAPGPCTIVADQYGNANYESAPEVVQTFTVLPDTTPPTLVSFTCTDTSPTMSDALSCSLTFSEPVTGVTSANIVATSATIAAASATSVTRSGAAWSVSVSTGRGSGQLNMSFVGGSEIADLNGNPLAATTVAGPSFVVDKGGTVTGAGLGHPDTGFGNQGYALFSGAPVAVSPSVAVLPDGRVLAAGTVGCDTVTALCSLQLSRYLPSGAVDATFGQSGRLVTAVTGVIYINDLKILADGRWQIDGMLSPDGGTTQVGFVARFATDGSPDLTLAGTGVVSLNALPAGSIVFSSTADAAGRILVVGKTGSVAGRGTDVVVARLTPDGLPDAYFGSAGVVTLGISTTGSRNDSGVGLVASPDGSVIVSGSTVAPTIGKNNYLLLRLDSSGVLDPTFGTNGVTSTRLTSTGNNSGGRLLQQSDGSLLQGGLVNSGQCGLVRYTSGGLVDPTFGAGGVVVLPQFRGCFYDIIAQPDGRLLLMGGNFATNVVDGEIARLLPSGAPDPTFGTAGVVTISDYDGTGGIALTPGGNVVTSLTIQDAADGVVKSYVVQLAAQPAVTTTTLAVSPVAPTYGQPITLTATVAYTGPVPPTGTVVFADGGTALGAPVALSPCAPVSAGTLCAVTTVTNAAVGPHAFAASYGGDVLYAASTSAVTASNVAPVVTTIGLASAPNPVIAGQAVTFTATLSPAAGPTGVVAFTDGTASLGTAAVSAGVATLSTTVLTVGSHTVTAGYAGDAYYAPATSAPVIQVVNPISPLATTTTLASSANPVLVGQPVVFTATVAAASGVPDGSVTFKQGTTTLGTATLIGGQANISTSYSTVGSRSITASYAGSAAFLPSTSVALTETVRSKFATTTALASSLNPAFVGQAVTFTATVSAPGTTVPDGLSVVFTSGTSTLGTATTAGGVAQWTTITLPVGSRGIRAAFGGSSTLSASTSPVLGQLVSKYPTTTVLGTMPNPSVYRQPVTVTAAVTSAGPALAGTVTFRSGTTSLGQASVTAGSATLTVASLPPGSPIITASYGGDPNSLSSVSAPVSEVVGPAPTSSTLTSSLNPSTAGRSVSFTAVVKTAVGVASGPVTFTAGSTVLGTVNVNSSGTAKISTSALPKGLVSVTASYVGTPAFQPSSGTIVQAVN